MPHPQTPVPLPPFPALGSASRCPRKPAAGVRAPTFPVTPTSSLPPVNPLTVTSLGCLLACLGFPHPGFISPVRARSAPPQQKASLMLRGRPLRCPNPEWALGDPKTVLQNEGDPEGIRLGDTGLYPSFSTGILGPGFYVPLWGAENRRSALSGLASDPPPRAPSLIRGRESVLHLHRLPSPCPVLSPFFVSLPLSISSCLLSPLLPSAS